MRKNLVIALAGLLVLFGAFSAITVYDTYFKWGRMWQTPAVRPHEQPIPLMEAGLVPTDGGEARYRAADPQALVSPFDAQSPEVIAEGENLYVLYCRQCHGLRHDGQGTVGQSFSPLPTDLRIPRVQQTADGTMFKEISYGLARPGARQPPLATTITVPDRWKIVHYVKSLGVR